MNVERQLKEVEQKLRKTKIEEKKTEEKRKSDIADKADEKIIRQKKKQQIKQEKKLLKSAQLSKAGLEIDVRRFNKALLKITVVVSALIIFAVIFYTIKYGVGAGGIAFYVFLSIIIGIPLSLILVRIGSYVTLDYMKYMRTKEVERYLPDYLQLCALNIKAGMPIDRALWFSVRPKFGVLATEMEIVAKRTLTGVELKTALTDLTQLFDSAVLQRAISLLVAGIDAGGELGDLLNKIATDIQETEILKKEMAASVMTYVIFIGFATIAAAPALMALSYNLLGVVQGLALKIGAGAAGSSSGPSFFSISPNSIDMNDYRTFAILSLTVTSTFSAIIISIIRKGTARESIRSIPFFVGISILIFYCAKYLLSGLLSGVM